MGIPIGKLALYTACAGIKPEECLPITLDVGTNNEKYLKDEYYIGLKQRRDRSSKYDELIEEVIEAIKELYGESTLVQFEDFGNLNAFRVLEKYQDKCTCFNDDIQGTASVVLAGLIASERITNIPLHKHKFVFLGAGEAGVGIADLIAYAVSEETGVTLEEARRNIHLVDSRGLVTGKRKNLAAHKIPYAHDFEGGNLNPSSGSLIDTVRSLQPTALIGVSAVPGAFGKDVVEEMAANNPNPIIFALSNPTSKAECTAEFAYTHTGGRCVFASGSPFDGLSVPEEVVQRNWGEGKEGRIFKYKGNGRVPGQGNNAYVFPGIGLGVIASGAKRVGDKDMYIAARTLAGMVSNGRIKEGCVYPELDRIREISTKIAVEIAENAYREGTTEESRPKDVLKFVKSIQYNPAM